LQQVVFQAVFEGGYVRLAALAFGRFAVSEQEIGPITPR